MLAFDFVVSAIATTLGVTIIGIIAACAGIGILFMAVAFLF